MPEKVHNLSFVDAKTSKEQIAFRSNCSSVQGRFVVRILTDALFTIVGHCPSAYLNGQYIGVIDKELPPRPLISQVFWVRVSIMDAEAFESDGLDHNSGSLNVCMRFGALGLFDIEVVMLEREEMGARLERFASTHDWDYAFKDHKSYCVIPYSDELSLVTEIVSFLRASGQDQPGLVFS